MRAVDKGAMMESPIVADRRSSGAVGFAMFAGVLMIMAGVWHAMVGFAGILEDQFFLTTPNYVFEFDATTWGWIHLTGGIIVAIAGVGIFSGAVWARSVGVLLAALSAIANFAFIPFYPVWSIVIIAVDVGVIWALTAHGRDVVE
jgi:hypothetical protein